eukprot:1369673-Amorphochlora_amoeboformis.AAC.1
MTSIGDVVGFTTLSASGTGVGWDGMKWDRIGWKDMGWDMTGWGWDRTGWGWGNDRDGDGWDKMGWDEMGWDVMGVGWVDNLCPERRIRGVLGCKGRHTNVPAKPAFR